MKSWGAPGGFSSFEQEIINHVVIDLNAVVVAAAGNTNADLDFYPASYNNVLSVGATNINDVKAGFGTFSNFIDLMAPGESVYTTDNNNNYRFAQGTSFSSPMVAGAAALLKARFPELSAPQIMEKLRVNADPIDQLSGNEAFNEKLGKGRLNVHKALIDQSSPSIRMKSFNYTNGKGPFAFFGDTLTITVDLINYLTPTQNAEVKLVSSSPYVTVLDSVFDVGNLNTLQSITNSNRPFKIVLSPNTPVNLIIKFRLGIEDGFYKDYQYFDIRTEREYVTLENNIWSLTVSSSGNLGYNEDVFFGGQGLRYGPQFISDQLGFIHTNVDQSVSDNITNDFDKNLRQFDFSSLKNIKLVNGSYADLELKSQFRDFTKSNVTVQHKTLMWKTSPDEDFTLMEYRLSNISGQNIPDLRAGLFIDLNINNKQTNRVDFDPSHQMIYAYDYLNDIYIGLALIEGDNPTGNAIDLGDFNGNTADIGTFFDKTQKFNKLVTQVNQAGVVGNGNDVAVMLSGKKDLLAPGESTVFTFALVGGNSLADLKNKTDMAQNKYTVLKENPSRLAFFQVCKMDQAVIDPAVGDQFNFYDDKNLSNLLFTGDAFVTSPLDMDTSFYVVNIDSVYNSEVYRIDVGIATPNVDFLMSTDSLFIDEETDFKVSFTDITTSSIAWEWDFGNGFKSNINDPVVQFPQTGVYPIQLIVINSTGCIDTLTKNLIVVERGPKPDLQNFEICENEIVIFDPVNADQIKVYSDPELLNLVFEGSIFTSAPLNKDTIFFITNIDSLYESLEKEVVILLSDLDVDFDILVDTLDLNNPQLLIFDNNSNDNEFNEWVVNDVFFSTNETISFTLSGENQLKVELIISNSNGCVKSLVKNLSITESPDPIVNAIEICEPETVVIRPENGSIFYFYEDAQLQDLIHKGSFYETGLIDQRTSIFITGMDHLKESQAVEQIIDLTSFNAIFNTDKTLVNILEDNSVQFTDVSPNAVEWFWDFGNGLTSTEQNPITQYEQTGIYQVEFQAINSLGCIDSEFLEIQVVEVLGIEENTKYALRLYPNPVRNMLIIEMNVPSNIIRIIDIYGNIHYETQSPTTSIDISTLPQGLYILQININRAIQSHRFLKTSY